MRPALSSKSKIQSSKFKSNPKLECQMPNLWILTFICILLSPAFATAGIPKDLKEAAEAADGVIVGLAMGHGEGGGFPYVEFRVLEVLKGKDPGEKLSAALPQEAISGLSIFKIRAEHGQLYIVPYRGPKNEKGRYTFAGPRFDSKEIIASPENIAIVKPGCRLFEIPSFEQALKEADAAAVATVNYDKAKIEDGKASLNIEGGKFYYRVEELLKGSLPERDITVLLGGKYLYYLFYGGNFPGKGEPLISQGPKILLVRKEGEKLYYAGPEFTSARFPATPENIAEARRLLELETVEPAARPGFDWTWWIVGAAAAIVALIAAILVSKVDYKYDRRRERLEKLRSADTSDSDAGEPGR